MNEKKISKHVPKSKPEFHHMEMLLAQRTLQLLASKKLKQEAIHTIKKHFSNRDLRVFFDSLTREVANSGVRFATGEPVDTKYIRDRVLRVWPRQQERTLQEVIEDAQSFLSQKLKDASARVSQAASDTGYKAPEQGELTIEFASPEEGDLTVIDQNTTKTIEFYGDKITGIKSASGVVYVPMKQICDNLGLDWSAQFKKLNTHGALRRCMVKIATQDSSGRQQDSICLEAEAIPLWMVTISPKKVAPELREKVTRYLFDVKKILSDVFLGQGFAVNPDPTKVNTQAMAEKLTELKMEKLRLAQRSFEILATDPSFSKKAILVHVEQATNDLFGVGIQNKTLLDCSEFLAGKGVSNIKASAPIFGKIVKVVYVERYSQLPKKHWRLVDGAQREVFCYTVEDLPVFEEAYARFCDLYPLYV